MATTYKVLGQVNPAATTNVNLYPCPAGKQAVISSITICNQAGTDATYRIAIRPSGATLSAEHYLVYGDTVPANGTKAYTIGVTLGAGDIITVYGSSANISFHAYGSEMA